MLMAMLFYIGCYTNEANPEGLHLLEIDPATGRMEKVESYKIDNPLYFARSLDGKYLFCNEKDGLGSFSIDTRGRLERRDFIALGGKAMCHLAAMPDGGSVAWAAYSNGQAGLVGVKDGRFTGEIRHDQQVGSGPHPAQKCAHCHMAEPTPDGSHYAVVDLGCDTITVYPASTNGEGRVFETAPRGAGPRHLIFHPNGRLAFVLTEHGRKLLVYRWDAEKGLTEKLDEARTVPVDFFGRNQDAAIRFSPDLKRVVVSNRGFDALTAFAFDAESGRLERPIHSPLPGSWPRDFVFVPGSDLALVTMEVSGTLVAAKYDADTGGFQAIDTLHGFFRPVAVLKAP